MTILHLLAATAATVGSLSLAPAQAQTAPVDKAARATVATPYSDAYVPRAMRQSRRELVPGAGVKDAAGPILLRLQPMQNLKKRFADADLDNSGTLNREEAHQAGLSVVEKNFDSIDTAQRGHVTFDDVNAYLIRRREEANAR
ncbi:EF-hand domain-containing protein [Duganella sp. Leaf126]|uniref:EF-hand domain-containing protein n=1 Tax=Duganella sp. Leaf126 TaxID=1736266 RepID=UPI000A962095|nr:EF-hand domain-containing protein [Duganella sp. Leaf126]